MKMISIATPCYNEESNVVELCERVKAVFEGLPDYAYEHIFIDNASTDRTVAVLKSIAATDSRVKVIVNTRNFGTSRSGFHVIREARGDAVLAIVSDLQMPPDKIPEFIKEWEKGYKIVLGTKSNAGQSSTIDLCRFAYYRFMSWLSDTPLVNDFNGFALYDKTVVDMLRQQHPDPRVYLRGLLCELGYEISKVPYVEQERKRGVSSYNFYSLYDFAVSGITAHSIFPLRIATFLGAALSLFSMLVAIGYLAYKLLYWYSFQAGNAPLIIGLFFFASVQILFLGLLGEYIGAIHVRIAPPPLVVEKERVNF